MKRGPKPGRPTTAEVVKTMLEASKAPVDDSKKPSHDARMQYYRVLEYVMINMKTAAMLGNYLGWYRSLREFHIMMVGYVPQDKLEGVGELFRQARILLDQHLAMTGHRDHVVQVAQQYRVSALDELYFQIEELLHRAARDMMLPVKAEDLEEFDEAKFLRDSDL